MFTQKFDSLVCEGNYIECEIDGFSCRATVYFDNDSFAPWEQEDGHGPVSGWTTRHKKAGEKILSQAEGAYLYYDFQEACKIAQRDGWGTKGDEGLSKAEKAAKAAQRDYEILKAWCNDEWQYFGVAVTVSREDVALTGKYDHALWGIEGNYPGSDNSSLTEVANELLEDALDAAKEKIRNLCK